MTSPAVKKILDALRANHDEAIRLRLELERALCPASEAGPRPPSFKPKTAAEALIRPHRLMGAFAWHETLQGVDFWRRQYNVGLLIPEGRAILEKWLAE